MADSLYIENDATVLGSQDMLRRSQTANIWARLCTAAAAAWGEAVTSDVQSPFPAAGFARERGSTPGLSPFWKLFRLCVVTTGKEGPIVLSLTQGPGLLISK